jgi:hypothetical protein
MVEHRNTDSPRQEFFVHHELLEKLCHPLRDEFREYWEVFDGEAVGRFAQYLYQVDYSYSVPIPVSASTSSSGTSNGHAELVKEPAGQTQTPVRPLTPFGSLEIPKYGTFSKRAFLIWPGKPASRNYEVVPLAHAKLYILSYGLGINAMSDYCIARLHYELTEISTPPIDQRILGNVVKLLRYAYCTPRGVATPQPLQPAWAELQRLVSQFCALNIGAMDGNREFKALLQESGVLATDMMAKNVRRMLSTESALARANETLVAAETARAKAEAQRKLRSRRIGPSF